MLFIKCLCLPGVTASGLQPPAIAGVSQFYQEFAAVKPDGLCGVAARL